MNILLISIILFFTMFVYSGFSKMNNFNKKVKFLQSKTKLPHIINMLGMFGVMSLEIFGSLLVILYFSNYVTIPNSIIKIVLLLFLLFLIVVTILYHPPWDKKIPFLSNLTTFAGLLIIYEKLI